MKRRLPVPLGLGRLLAVCFVFAVVPPIASGADPWGAATDLSATGASATVPQNALSSDGTRATAIWLRSNGTHTIVQSASATITAGTTTWGAVTDLSATGQSATVPQIALSSDGTRATAIWLRSNGTYTIVQSASATISAGTATWGAVTDLSATGVSALTPQIALSSDGTATTAIWIRGSGAVQAASATITAGTATWSAVTDISTGLNASVPQIALSSDGTQATAIWLRNLMFYSASATITAGTATWGATGDTASGNRGGSPQIALSSDGTQAIAIWWGVVSSKNIAQSASATITAGTATWGAVTDLSAAGQHATVTQIALSSDGTRATAIWLRSNGTNTIVQSASATISGSTATWSAVTDLSATLQSALAPQVALSSDGTQATAIWTRSDGSKTIVQTESATIATGTATWGAVTDLSATGQHATVAQIGLSSDGTRATAIWLRSNGTNTIVQSASTGVAPTATAVSPTGLPPAGGSLTLTGTGFFTGATATVDGTSCSSLTVVSATSITCTAAAHAAGAVSIVVTNTNGLTGTLAGAVTYASVAAPTVTAVSPTGLPLAGGALTITGTGFLTGATATVGGASCSSLTVVSATSITCTAAAHAAGAVSVVVTNTDSLTGTLAGAVTYAGAAPTVEAVSPPETAIAPTVTGVAPVLVPLAGGSLTITGTGFLTGATATVGGTSCTGLTVVSATSITCTAAAHAAGAVSVGVTNTDGLTHALAGAVTYAGAPTVTAVSPAGLPLAGRWVTITGTGFLARATATIGGAACTSLTVISATSITCTAAAQAAGAVAVVVTNADGQTASLASAVTYQAAATVPASLPPAAGTPTNTGTGTSSSPSATARQQLDRLEQARPSALVDGPVFELIPVPANLKQAVSNPSVPRQITGPDRSSQWLFEPGKAFWQTAPNTQTNIILQTWTFAGGSPLQGLRQLALQQAARSGATAQATCTSFEQAGAGIVCKGRGLSARRPVPRLTVYASGSATLKKGARLAVKMKRTTKVIPGIYFTVVRIQSATDPKKFGFIISRPYNVTAAKLAADRAATTTRPSPARPRR